MIPRALEPTLRRLAAGFPMIAVTGPRQSGKTTLARALFGDLESAGIGDQSSMS